MRVGIIKKINKFKSNQGAIKYLKNTSWLFGEKVLRMTIGLFVAVWVTRYLGPEQFGLFSYAQSFVGLFVVIATLGLDSIVVRELVNNDNTRDEILGTAFYLKLIGAIGVIFILIVAVMFTEHSMQVNIFIFIISFGTIFQSFNVIDYYFQSKVLSKYLVYSNVITLITSSLIKVILIYCEAPLIYFVSVILIDTLVFALGQIYFYTYLKLKIKKWKFNKYLAISMLKESAPLIIAGVVNSASMKIDQIMINSSLGSIEVGYYSSAVRLSEVWFGIGVIICNSLFPAILNAKKISEHLYYDRIYKLFRFLVVISSMLSFAVYFLSDFIIVGLYGDVFINSSSVLAVHIFSAIFVYLGVASGRWLISEGKTKLNLYRNLIALCVNIILNIVFINKFGIVGAAYASLISYIVGFYLFDLVLKETRPVFVLKSKALLLVFPSTSLKR